MAMTMTGEVQLAAPRQTVWEMLNDPDVLKATIPGCESLEKTSDTSFAAVAVTKIGPVKAKWKGKVTLTDLDPPNGYRISGGLRWMLGDRFELKGTVTQIELDQAYIDTTFEADAARRSGKAVEGVSHGRRAAGPVEELHARL